MGATQRLRLSDVRSVFRIVADARELRHDPPRQEVVIVDAMVRLLDADYGHAVRYGEFRPHAPTYVRQISFGTVRDPVFHRYVSEWGRAHPVDEDPMKPNIWDKAGPVHTTSRAREISLDDLRRYRIYEELAEPARIHDGVVTFFRYPHSNHTRGYGFTRTLDKQEFSPRDLRVTHLLCTELYRLYLQGALEEPDPLHGLPARLTRLTRDLMTGLSQKQIAMHRNLSYETVRSYTKELYDRLGVSSREALMANLLKPAAGRTRQKRQAVSRPAGP